MPNDTDGEIEGRNAGTLLMVLQRRFELIRRIESNYSERMSAAIDQERHAIVPAISAIEPGLKKPPPQ